MSEEIPRLEEQDRSKPTLGKRSGNPAVRADTVMGRADRLDERRRQQINNQIQIINKLKGELEDLKHEVWGSSIVMYCLLQKIDTFNTETDEYDPVIVTRKELDNAKGGAVTSRLDEMGNIYITIDTKEQA